MEQSLVDATPQAVEPSYIGVRGPVVSLLYFDMRSVLAQSATGGRSGQIGISGM